MLLICRDDPEKLNRADGMCAIYFSAKLTSLRGLLSFMNVEKLFL
jgi:hypothetical protein